MTSELLGSLVRTTFKLPLLLAAIEGGSSRATHEPPAVAGGPDDAT